MTKKQAGFTPGPWYVAGANIRSDQHPDGDALVMVRGELFHQDGDYNGLMVTEEQAANLALAAAAPAMLAALEAVAATQAGRHHGSCTSLWSATRTAGPCDCYVTLAALEASASMLVQDAISAATK